MFVNFYLPEHLSSFGINRVNVCCLISEVCDDITVISLFERNGTPHASLNLQCPVHATRFRIEHVDFAFRCCYIHASTSNNGLSTSGTRSREAKRPFQLQPRHILCTQSGGIGGLEPSIRDTVAPAVPDGSRHSNCCRGRCRSTEGGFRN